MDRAAKDRVQARPRCRSADISLHAEEILSRKLFCPRRCNRRSGRWLGCGQALNQFKSSFRLAAAATDAKRRPDFQTSRLAACAPQTITSSRKLPSLVPRIPSSFPPLTRIPPGLLALAGLPVYLVSSHAARFLRGLRLCVNVG